jgi:hypothetical protein
MIGKTSLRLRLSLAASLTVALLFTPAYGAWAQQKAAVDTTSGGSAETEHDLIVKLLAKIDKLENRVQQLEGKPAEAPAASPTPAPAAVEAQTDTMSMPGGGHELHLSEGLSLKIRGFSDVTFKASNDNTTHSAFALGTTDLFVTSRLSDSLSVIGEFGFEAGSDNIVGVDLERLMLNYAPNDHLNLSIGRTHSMVGYYNTAYHHGAWFQTSVVRPFLFRFEDGGGILPVHNVGLSAMGLVPSGKLGLHYVAEVGNGRSYSTDQAVQNTVDENNGKSFNLGMFVTPGNHGLQTGFSVYHDHLTPGTGVNLGQNIIAGHLVYVTPKFELLNEGILMRNTPDGANVTFNTPGFYSQISRQFASKYRPYFRYEYINASHRDPIVGSVGRFHGPTAGLRFDASTYAALKLEYGREERRGLAPVNQLNSQVAFTF